MTKMSNLGKFEIVSIVEILYYKESLLLKVGVKQVRIFRMVVGLADSENFSMGADFNEELTDVTVSVVADSNSLYVLRRYCYTARRFIQEIKIFCNYHQ